MRLPLLLLVVFATARPSLAEGPSRAEKVRADRAKVEAEGFWIYNNLPRAFEQARQTGKPLLVVLRCIPCEECVKLDDELIDRNLRVRPLLEKFVCARVVATNGLDLATFQYDYDQSFAAFMLNADGTIYGRFGTRSHRTEWLGDVSVEGLAEALEGALELHRDFPAHRAALAAKRGPAPPVASPELFPNLKTKYTATLNYSGNVVQSCIHCHQVGEAIRQLYRDRSEPIPEEVLFPYPHPKSQGLILDPRRRAAVLQVEQGSSAANAGFEAGDSILSLAGQPLVSMADVQWVLERTPARGATITAQVDRRGKPVELKWTLVDGWRRKDDISWRATSWPFRRMGFGGMWLEDLPAAQRSDLKLADGATALRVRHVGQYGPYIAAKKAGVLVGDVIVGCDGRNDFVRETDLLAYAVNAHRAGESIQFTLLRDGQQIDVRVACQP